MRMGESMREAVLKEVEKYIMWRKNIDAQYMVMRTVLYTYEEKVRHLGA